jgi:hypothetical protein
MGSHKAGLPAKILRVSSIQGVLVGHVTVTSKALSAQDLPTSTPLSTPSRERTAPPFLPHTERQNRRCDPLRVLRLR